MSERGLYLTFLEANQRSEITMYWDVAPKTCAAIWEACATPFQWDASHAMFSGPEIMTGLPETHRNFDPLDPAREPDHPARGGGIAVVLPAEELLQDRPSEFWEIGIFYAHGGRTFGPTGWIPCNYFGKITKGLDEFAAQCARIRREGVKRVEIGRA